MNNQNDAIRFVSRDKRETVTFENEAEMNAFLDAEAAKDNESANAFRAAFSRGEYPSNRDMLDNMNEERRKKIIDWHKSQPYFQYLDWENWLNSTEMTTINFIKNKGRFTDDADGEEKNYFILEYVPEYNEGLDYVFAYCLEDQTTLYVPDPKYNISEAPKE